MISSLGPQISTTKTSCLVHTPQIHNHRSKYFSSRIPRHAALSSTRRQLTRCSATVLTSLKDLDSLLSNDAKEAEAVALMKNLAESGILKGFGKARIVPKRSYTLEELRINKIDPRQFLAPKDNTLTKVRTTLQVAFASGLVASYFAGWADLSQLVQYTIIVAFVLTVDQIGNAGGLEALLIDSSARLTGNYADRVSYHEAGHFLVSYLCGLLPKGYSLSSLDLFIKKRQLNVQAGTVFCDGEFQKEVSSGKLTSSSLDTFACVALAGVAAEWLKFGKAEGGLADVQQLDQLLQALRFSQAKADDEVRWAVLNVVSLLRRHQATHGKLAEAMSSGKSVAECIAVIEASLANVEDI